MPSSKAGLGTGRKRLTSSKAGTGRHDSHSNRSSHHQPEHSFSPAAPVFAGNWSRSCQAHRGFPRKKPRFQACRRTAGRPWNQRKEVAGHPRQSRSHASWENRFPSSQRRGILILNNRSAFHDESNASNCRNVARGIAVDSDQVGKQAVSHSTNPIFHVQDLRVDGCCRAQSIKRGHSEINQCFKFAAVLAVSKDTNIAAAGDRDMRIQRSLETRTLSIEISGNGDGGRQCGTQRYIVLFHQAKHLGSAGVAVFDAFDSSQSGPPHPFRSRCMGRHWAAAALCGFDNKRLGNSGHKKAQKTQKDFRCFLCLFAAKTLSRTFTFRSHTPSSSDKDNYVPIPRSARSEKYSSRFLSISSQ